MNSQRLSTFFIIWLGLTILLFVFNPTTPPPGTAGKGAHGDHGDLGEAKAPRLVGPPIEVANGSFHALFGRDGSLLGVKVDRFKEEILGFQLIPDEIYKNLSAQQLQKSPPAFSAGLHLGRALVPPSDPRRLSLVATARQVDLSTRFQTEDPDGKLLPKGIQVIREYALDKTRFLVDLKLVIKNAGTTPLTVTTATVPIHLFAGPLLAAESDIPEAFSGHDGGVVNSLSPSAEPALATTDSRWIGVRNQYYAFVLHKVKGAGSYVHSLASYRDVKGASQSAPMVGFRVTPSSLKPGQSDELAFRIYCGPKVQTDLPPEYARVFNNWDGITGPIGRWMFIILQFFHAVTGNYGFSILLLTLLVKVLLHPLNYSQTVNMQRMQELQPKIKALKAKYKDPQELQRKTLELYQQYNLNPLGGCFPMLVQIPIFIALYSCLRGAIELKGVSFWWMSDLSKSDTTTLLALIFALSIFLNSKLMQPAGGMDNDQQAMMNKMMPIMMYGMFVFMPVPAGVMIYLAAQSLLGVLETRYTLGKLPKKGGKKVVQNQKEKAAQKPGETED